MTYFLNFSHNFSVSVIFVIFNFTIFLLGCREAAVVRLETTAKNSLKFPELVSVEPSNNASRVKRNAEIIFSFSEPLDPKTLSVNTEDTECSGTIQISTNDFKRCVRMNPFELNDNFSAES